MNDARQSLRVTAITQVDEWVRCYRLEAAQPDGKLAPFLPGQYLNIFYEIDGSTTSRPYSIASSPKDAEQGFYELFIHGGGGFTSPWLFRHIAMGDMLSCSYPEGTFCYRPGCDSTHLVAVSGGMSVTPLRAFARAVVDGSLDVDLTVFCGWDYCHEVLFMDEFLQYARDCPRFRVVFAVAKEPCPKAVHGYVDRKLIESYTTLQNATLFLCGPEEMYRFLSQELAPCRIPAGRWRREIPGEIKTPLGQPDAPPVQKGSVSLTLRRQGQAVRLRAGREESLLVALERAGVQPKARCRSGRCGYCLARLLAGEVYVPAAWDTRTPQQKAERKIHPCCSFPLSDIVLEAE